MRRAATVLVLLAAGCRPDFGAPPSLISAERVIAVRFEPPEAAPGARVTAAALVAAPGGTTTPALAWSVCKTPKPPTENGVVAPACLDAGGTAALGSSAVPMPLTLPFDGCRLFGPETPPAMPGQPPAQPRAPDVTGGYYQPVRADLGSAATVGLARIRCALAGASMETAADFAARYSNNRNPTLAALSATVDGAAVALDALPAGRVVHFSAAAGDGDAEVFPVLDPQSQTLVDTVETLSFAWFAADGSLASENTTGANDWTAPAAAGSTHLWIVLRDSRGGVAFADYALTYR